MIDFTELAVRINIGLGLTAIALLLFFIFLAKFPTKKSSSRN